MNKKPPRLGGSSGRAGPLAIFCLSLYRSGGEKDLLITPVF